MAGSLVIKKWSKFSDKITLILVLILLANSCTKPPDPLSYTEALFDLSFARAERDTLREGVNKSIEDYKNLHNYSIENSIPPSLIFNPLPVGFNVDQNQEQIYWQLDNEIGLPAKLEDLAFYTVADLSVLIKQGKITSIQLTNIYLKRLKQFGDTLQSVITITEELALKQAQRADLEIAEGKYRGPLHGIPYGAKDLLAVGGYKTTWGAMPYKDQVIDENATVIKKLEEAGAVLVAKLTMGALAWGDVWYGGKTRNPWNLEQGSSGSSAGSASSTVAGLVAFSIGTETLGSIVSPSARCGATGLRPTFGRVSRTGAMALSWSMDKIGPICRSAEDCALVFDAIRGVDGLDQSLIDAAFNYRPVPDLANLKIGYIQDLFERDYGNKENDSVSLEVLKELGADLEPVSLPEDIPVGALRLILNVEAAAAFDELTRSNKDSLMVRQIKNAWPNVFREARFIPAVEYIQANRVRFDLIQKMHKIFEKFDVVVTPSFGSQLTITNLTGHPVVVVPNGFNEEGSPTSISFLGNLFDEATILSVAKVYQDATEFDDLHPPLFKLH